MVMVLLFGFLGIPSPSIAGVVPICYGDGPKDVNKPFMVTGYSDGQVYFK